MKVYTLYVSDWGQFEDRMEWVDSVWSAKEKAEARLKVLIDEGLVAKEKYENREDIQDEDNDENPPSHYLYHVCSGVIQEFELDSTREQ